MAGTNKREACAGWVTAPRHKVFFQASNYKLWRGQILSADLYCWNFLTKPQEAEWGHCRSSTTEAEPQRHHSLKASRVECIDVWKKEMVWTLEVVCQNLLKPRWHTSSSDFSRQVKLRTWLPFPQCVGTLNHMFSNGFLLLVAEAGERQAVERHGPFSSSVFQCTATARGAGKTR